MNWRPAILFLEGFCLIGCEVIGGFEDVTGVAEGGTAGQEPGGGSGGDAGGAGISGQGAVGGSGGLAAGGSAGFATAPPDLPGPMLVRVNRADGDPFWIDKTEISVSDYADFIADSPQRADDAACEWNDAFTPECGPGDAEQPVVCVDWCDARDYCTWAGKTLCLGQFNDGANPLESDWYAACSNDGSDTYPYGKVYDAQFCNGADRSAGVSTDPVGTNTACASEAGAIDLSGNVAEWTDECQQARGATDPCRARGGSFKRDANALQCNVLEAPSRETRRDDIGFRCCWYPE